MFSIDNATRRITVSDDKGRELIFNASIFSLSKSADYSTLFDAVNDFLSREPATTRAALFGYYAEALDLIRLEDGNHYRDDKLNKIIIKIFNLIKVSKVDYYVKEVSGIRPPPDVQPDFNSIDSGFKRERTYDQPEYMDLIVLILLFRFCTPIWGEYVSIIRSSTAVVKESYYAYMLLKNSAIIELPAYARLYRYIQAQLTDSIDTNITTLVGLGKDEIPEWLMATVIVKKLTVHNLAHRNENVVAAMHRSIKSQLNTPASHLTESTNYRQRKVVNRDSDDGQEQSFVETYRGRAPTFYDLEMNIVYLSSPIRKLCDDYDETFNPEIADAVEAVTQGIEHIQLLDYHHILTLWVMDRMLLTVGPDMMERSALANAMRTVQSLLHHWGLHNLALLVTSDRIDDESGEYAVLSNALEVLPVDVLDQLDLIYPWVVPGANTKNHLVARNANYGFIAIHSLAEELSQYNYAVRVPAFLTSKDVQVDNYGHMTPPGSILKELAQLLIILDKLSPVQSF